MNLFYEYVNLEKKLPIQHEIYKDAKIGQWYSEYKKKIKIINDQSYIALTTNEAIANDDIRNIIINNLRIFLEKYRGANFDDKTMDITSVDNNDQPVIEDNRGVNFDDNTICLTPVDSNDQQVVNNPAPIIPKKEISKQTIQKLKRKNIIVTDD